MAHEAARAAPISLSPLLYATAFGMAIGNTLRVCDEAVVLPSASRSSESGAMKNVVVHLNGEKLPVQGFADYVRALGPVHVLDDAPAGKRQQLEADVLALRAAERRMQRDLGVHRRRERTMVLRLALKAREGVRRRRRRQPGPRLRRLTASTCRC